jgi:TRAP transporter 4TM/12TM fusion protein
MLSKSEENAAADSKGIKFTKIALSVVSIIMIAYHGLYLFKPTGNALLHQNIHLAIAFIILSLMTVIGAKNKIEIMTGALLLIISLVTTIYIHINYERLHMWAGFPESWDIVIGIVLVLLVTWFTFKNWGAVFPILAGLSVLYAFFGHHISGALGHPELDPKLVLSNMGIGFDGVYGIMLNLSANMIFFFVIFGALFEAVGVTSFFRELGKTIGNKFRGGAAVGSAVSSSMLGMCTGGSIVNVALAGAFTIPLMKDSKFSSEVAGGIESTASTGGGLTPPVMGVAIFIMAGLLNTTYTDLLPSVILPAVMFYFGMFLSIFLVIRRDSIPKFIMPVKIQAVKAGWPVFVIPITLMTVILLKRYPPAFAAFFTVTALLIVASFNVNTRPTVKKLIKGFTKGCVTMASLAVVLAMIGIFVSMLNMTNAGPKLTSIIMMISGGHVLFTLFLTMFLCMILGCALPAPVAYMVVALVVAPSLKDLGIPIVATHLFCFYFSFLSAVTPPIAGAAMVASRIANASFMKTSMEALKFSLPFFVVPYFVVFNPVVVFKAQPVVAAATGLTMMVLSSSCLAFFAFGQLFGPLSKIERAIFLLLSIFAVIQTSAYGLGAAGIIFVAFVIMMIYRWKNKVEEEMVTAESL